MSFPSSLLFCCLGIQQCINITGNFLKLGVLKFEDAKDAVAAFTTAGSVIIELLNLRKKDDAVMGKLDELNRNINTVRSFCFLSIYRRHFEYSTPVWLL